MYCKFIENKKGSVRERRERSTHSGRRQGAHPQHRVARRSLFPADIGVHVHRGKLGALVAEVDLPAHRSGDVRDGRDGRPTVFAEFSGRVNVQVRVGGGAARSSESSSEDEQVVGGEGLSGECANTMQRDYTFGVSASVREMCRVQTVRDLLVYASSLSSASRFGSPSGRSRMSLIWNSGSKRSPTAGVNWRRG